jgi:hypothetical protein
LRISFGNFGRRLLAEGKKGRRRRVGSALYYDRTQVGIDTNNKILLYVVMRYEYEIERDPPIT